jgi:UDP-2,3-diacylglucosamine pyrophosphatase LpxH
MLTDCNIIQVGDFGIGFTTEYNDRKILNNLNDKLSEKNIKLYAIRGNHDNPDFFNGDYTFSNLSLLPDYTVLELDSKNILCIGGAISVDRIPRIIENMSYSRVGSTFRCHWYDEKVIFDEGKLKEFKDIDVIVTHTAPDYCAPLNKIGFGSLVEEFSVNDPTLKDELKEERAIMTDMFQILFENNDIKYHFYGHFHRSHVEKIGNCTHRILGINEMFELPE